MTQHSKVTQTNSVKQEKRSYKSPYNTLYFEEAVEKKGWIRAHLFLILRRISQISIILLFTIPFAIMNQDVLSGNFDNPLSGEREISEIADNFTNSEGLRKEEFRVLQGTLANSELLEVIPLGDPFVFVQSLVAQNVYPLMGVLGVLLITVFYLIFGGRTYCSFVCPINIVTDASSWIRRQLRINNQLTVSKKARYYILGIVVVVSLIFQVIAWELVNPITGLFRALVYGGLTITNIGVTFSIIIFITDIIGSANLWCGHLCPVGAFYGILGKKTMLHMSAPNLEACDDCMDCYKVCPEPHVLKPLLQQRKEILEASLMPSIGFSDCTRCGRCLDVCAENVFKYRLIKKHHSINHQPMNIQPILKEREL